MSSSMDFPLGKVSDNRAKRTHSETTCVPKPKPILSLLAPVPLLQDENRLSNTSHIPHSSSLAMSGDCPFRRSADNAHIKLARSASFSTYAGRDTVGLQPLLPTLPNSNPVSITAETLLDLLNGRDLGRNYDKIVILDARYEYEFEGGHIRDAINVPQITMAEMLKEEFLKENLGARMCVIIHCEFSSQRGPKLFRQLREIDRTMNRANWPNLSFPEIYVLAGGYKEFYYKFSEWCTPENYVPMNHPAYFEHCLEATRLSKSQGCIKSIKRSASNLPRMNSMPLFPPSSDLAMSTSSDPDSSMVDSNSTGFSRASTSPISSRFGAALAYNSNQLHYDNNNNSELMQPDEPPEKTLYRSQTVSRETRKPHRSPRPNIQVSRQQQSTEFEEEDSPPTPTRPHTARARLFERKSLCLQSPRF